MVAVISTPTEILIKPERRHHRCFTIFAVSVFIISISLSIMSAITSYYAHECHRDYTMVKSMCQPEMEKLETLLHTNIPNMNGSIAVDRLRAACDATKRCFAPLRCQSSDFYLPDQCKAYQFFGNTFNSCRLKIHRTARHRDSRCLKEFFHKGIVSCNTIDRNVMCVYEHVMSYCPKLSRELMENTRRYKRAVGCYGYYLT